MMSDPTDRELFDNDQDITDTHVLLDELGAPRHRNGEPLSIYERMRWIRDHAPGVWRLMFTEFMAMYSTGQPPQPPNSPPRA